MTKRQLGFYVDLTRCIGCHTCALACKEKNDLELGPRWRRVRVIEGGAYPRPFSYFISMSCNHCAEPICIKVCPTRAYHKREDGLVVHDPEQCIGCQYCTYACPYAAPQFDESRGKVGKCSGCYELIDRGEQPACVQACVTRAMEFGYLDELAARHPDGTKALPILPDPKLTDPSTLVKPKPEAYSPATRVIDGQRTRLL